MKNKITKIFITQFLPNNPVIVEAGAHKGRTTIEMSTLWKNAIIHAFEPTEMYDKLVQNTQEYFNIKTYRKALSSTTTSKMMYACTGKYTQLSSLHRPSEYFTKNPKFTFNEITIDTITLDEWAEQYQVIHIDMLWLDAQGGELTILKGAEKSLKNISLLFLEANLVSRYEDSVLYDELKHWLLEQDFIEIAVDEEIHNNRFNVLFKKKA